MVQPLLGVSALATFMDVAILSDTHVPERAQRLPDWVRRRLGDAGHVIHAGDFVSQAAYTTVTELAGGAGNVESRVTAVRGNMDTAELGLPGIATVDLGGVQFVVVHGTGPPSTWADRVSETVRDHGHSGAIGVAGHTHEPTDLTVDGVRLLNPGSATGARPAERATMISATVQDGDLQVELIEDGRPLG